ncbi:BA14K family protein [uncultured Cohaesibacter sp.]|uniref:BA14K family protein n=1 Tax=uncultured Cohaesibacter sp. TaxID=1002546 RepID=UPI00293020F3|nr:BA14K family protein [uncultured Cohaesibacter sp.]
MLATLGTAVPGGSAYAFGPPPPPRDYGSPPPRPFYGPQPPRPYFRPAPPRPYYRPPPPRPVYRPAPRPYCNVPACAARYRSFRAWDCSYQPYNGPRRLCRM